MLVSYAPNHEDVVLWRALGHIERGRYAVSDAAGEDVVRVFAEAGWERVEDPEQPLHLLVTTTPDAGSRPWVLVVRDIRETAVPGYQHCLFDGVSRFFVHDDHPELAADLSFPACTRDDFTTAGERDLLAQVVHWRNTALGTWARAVQESRLGDLEARELERSRGRLAELRERVQRLRGRAEEAERRVMEIESSTSWRVTRPLRGAGGSARRLARRDR